MPRSIDSHREDLLHHLLSLPAGEVIAGFCEHGAGWPEVEERYQVSREEYRVILRRAYIAKKGGGA